MQNSLGSRSNIIRHFADEIFEAYQLQDNRTEIASDFSNRFQKCFKQCTAGVPRNLNVRKMYATRLAKDLHLILTPSHQFRVKSARTISKKLETIRKLVEDVRQSHGLYWLSSQAALDFLSKNIQDDILLMNEVLNQAKDGSRVSNLTSAREFGATSMVKAFNLFLGRAHKREKAGELRLLHPVTRPLFERTLAGDKKPTSFEFNAVRATSVCLWAAGHIYTTDTIEDWLKEADIAKAAAKKTTVSK